MKLKKFFAALLTAAMAFAITTTIIPANFVMADPTAVVESTNPWGSGGQIVLNLSGCSGYQTITVVVEFNGSVTNAGGWGFDSYTVSGNRVTATVSADGPNSWGFDGNVGIQVDGSNITSVSLISIEGSGTASATTPTNPTNNSNTGNNDNQNNNDSSATADMTYAGTVGDDWLTTDGDKIVDMNGTEVWLTGLSWFGYNTGSNLFDGVWGCNLTSAIEGIADHGFNLLRVPMSAELLLQWKNGEYPQANYNQAYNSELNSMNSLEIWEYVLALCNQNGIKVMIDIHSLETDAMGHMAPLWYTSNMTEEQYYEAIEWLAERYMNNDTVVAYDLKNEPHGKASEPDHAIWNDSDAQNNWKRAAERAGNIILDYNPHALIVIEGIQIYPTNPQGNNFTSTNDEDYYNSWWGGNLRAVADYPIDFGSEERNRQVIYSPHDYGPAVYAQPWFEGGFTYQSLMDDYWYDSWLFIDDQEIAPLLIGEWGGFMTGDNLTWMTYMRQLIAEYHLNHTFWCYNANSGDTGGLVLDDFTTWDEEKYAFVSEVLWQTPEGQFIGLDHEVALGDNGISLGEYSGMDIEASVNPPHESSGDSATTTEANTDSETIIGGADEPQAVKLESASPVGAVLKVLLGTLITVLVIAGGAGAYYLGRYYPKKKD